MHGLIKTTRKPGVLLGVRPRYVHSTNRYTLRLKQGEVDHRQSLKRKHALICRHIPTHDRPSL
jgi:hypothetical protein